MTLYKLAISLKRVQTFIFDVRRLRTMLGANALVGQTMRHELVKELGGDGYRLDWPEQGGKQILDDPLSPADPIDRDDPAALFERGVLARDGGHFIAVFGSEPEAEAFRAKAEEVLSRRLPGVLYDIEISPLGESTTRDPDRKAEARGASSDELLDEHLSHLPVFQICQETGRGPASARQQYPGEGPRWVGPSVELRREAGDAFRAGRTHDIVRLLGSALYPQSKRWSEPHDLHQLTDGGYLALVHADGNRVGQRYKDWKEKAASRDVIAQEAHGERFFHSLRVAVRRALVTAIDKTFDQDQGDRPRPYEVLMLGGDDLLVACRAGSALRFAKNFAEALKEIPLADNEGPLDVGIGVAIAQASYPLHRLHELAEDLASSAKRLYRTLDVSRRRSVIDWQVVTQSWFAGVESGRHRSEVVRYEVEGKTQTLALSRRPYVVIGEGGLDQLMDAANGLDDDMEKAARSPLRALRGACEQGALSGEIAFQKLPKATQDLLGGALWEQLGEVRATRALDIVGIREIARLGKNKHDEVDKQ